MSRKLISKILGCGNSDVGLDFRSAASRRPGVDVRDEIAVGVHLRPALRRPKSGHLLPPRFPRLSIVGRTLSIDYKYLKN
jgi:hypothetical protein